MLRARRERHKIKYCNSQMSQSQISSRVWHSSNLQSFVRRRYFLISFPVKRPDIVHQQTGMIFGKLYETGAFLFTHTNVFENESIYSIIIITIDEYWWKHLYNPSTPAEGPLSSIHVEQSAKGPPAAHSHPFPLPARQDARPDMAVRPQWYALRGHHWGVWWVHECGAGGCARNLSRRPWTRSSWYFLVKFFNLLTHLGRIMLKGDNISLVQTVNINK